MQCCSVAQSYYFLKGVDELPFYPLSQRSFGYRLRLEPTIPLILYPDEKSIHYQIINPDLYDYLIELFPEFVTQSGDFLLQEPSEAFLFEQFIYWFYNA
jgi:hypothetical protein